MHVIAHNSTHAPRSASSAHCCALRFGPARSSVACVITTGHVRDRLRDRVVLGRAHVTGREDRVVIADQRQDLVGLGEQLAVAVGHDDARAGYAELRGHAVLEVLAAAQRRQPDDPGAEAEAADLDGGRIHAADFTVAADPAEHRDGVADVALDRPRERRGGRVVRLPARSPGGRLRRPSWAASERVDRTGPVRVGAEVAMEIGRSGQVDAHQRRAYREATLRSDTHVQVCVDCNPVPAPGQAAPRRTERRGAAPAQRTTSSATGSRSSSATAPGPTPSTTRSRAGSQRSSSSGFPPRGRATSRCCSTTRPTTCSRSAARR